MWMTFYSAFHGGGRTPLFTSQQTARPEQVFRTLAENERHALTQESGVKHARYHSFAAILGVTACRHARRAIPLADEEVGVIATGGPLHTPTAWDFARTAQRKGVDLLNPMYFAHLLQSSVGCSVAAECGAKAFAMTVGHDGSAFLKSLAAVQDLIRGGFAKAVIMPCVSAGELRNQQIHRFAGHPERVADVGLCCAVSTVPPADEVLGLELIAVSSSFRPRSPGAPDSREGFAMSARPEGDTNSGCEAPPRKALRWLEGVEAYAAAGAVAMVEAVGNALDGHTRLTLLVTLFSGGAVDTGQEELGAQIRVCLLPQSFRNLAE
jgi:hypothetical protein